MKPTIVICSSANFYEHVNELAVQLGTQGFDVVVPATAVKMRQSGDYDVVAVKTWYDKPADFTVKADLMRGHFDEIADGDIVLVVNDEKHGVPGYIGPNVLIEIGLAFYLSKPIYVLNTIAEDMPVYEEVLGMGAVILAGDISKLHEKGVE